MQTFLVVLLVLVPVLYTWKWNDIGKKLAKGTPEIGVLAQEVQIVNPDAVITGPDGYLMVNYGRL
ncbi:MAG: tail fiber domain-containing protein [Marivivens sp.]|nr:tail fiber domain-containing protein [Marivivens sp.]